MNVFIGALELSSVRSWWNRMLEQGSDMQAYENLSENALFSFPLILIGVILGIAIALFVNVFTKRVLGELVRTLLAQDVLSAESAKTMGELGFSKNFLLRYAVKGNVSLRRVVVCCEEEEFLRKQEEERENSPSSKKFRAKSFRIDSQKHHFYIPEEQRDAAAMKFEKKGTSLGAMLILLAILLVLLIVLLAALPTLMSWLDTLIGSFGSSENNIV